MPPGFLKWTCLVCVAAASVTSPARADDQPRVRTLCPGDDLVWRIEAGQELLDGRNEVRCHVDDDGAVDLGRHGKVRVSGLTLSEAKLAMETHVAVRAQARIETIDRVSDLPHKPLEPAAFMAGSPTADANVRDQAHRVVRPTLPDARIVQARTVASYNPVTVVPGAAPLLANLSTPGIDRLIFEHAKLAQRSAPSCNDRFQRQRPLQTASVNRDASQRAGSFTGTVSAASFSTIDQQTAQAGTSPYHPQRAMPVCQASCAGPDPFPTDIASAPSDSGPHNAKPQALKSGWQRLCDRAKGIRFPWSKTSDGP